MLLSLSPSCRGAFFGFGDDLIAVAIQNHARITGANEADMHISGFQNCHNAPATLNEFACIFFKPAYADIAPSVSKIFLIWGREMCVEPSQFVAQTVPEIGRHKALLSGYTASLKYAVINTLFA